MVGSISQSFKKKKKSKYNGFWNDPENAEIENGLTQNNLENLEYTFYWFKKENENT